MALQVRTALASRRTDLCVRSVRRSLRAGYRFVGPTSVYAFMQNVGVVNDHVHGCFRAIDYTRPAISDR